jgi:hypothetical protein
MIAPAPRTCALCGWRDATHTTGWEGRMVAACATCDPPIERVRLGYGKTGRALALQQRGERMEAVLRAVTHNPGATVGELCQVLGVPMGHHTRRGFERPYMRIVAALHRARRAGLLVSERDSNRHRYYPAATNG